MVRTQFIIVKCWLSTPSLFYLRILRITLFFDCESNGGMNTFNFFKFMVGLQNDDRGSWILSTIPLSKHCCYIIIWMNEFNNKGFKKKDFLIPLGLVILLNPTGEVRTRSPTFNSGSLWVLSHLSVLNAVVSSMNCSLCCLKLSKILK